MLKLLQRIGKFVAVVDNELVRAQQVDITSNDLSLQQKDSPAHSVAWIPHAAAGAAPLFAVDRKPTARAYVTIYRDAEWAIPR